MTEPTPTVFVLEDDSSMREALRRLLESVGHAVHCFESSRDFLAFPRPDAPACLVLDIRMPGKSGLELQREFVSAGDQIPIVFISGHADVAMSVRAMKAGAIEFLTKPFRDQDLLDAIDLGLRSDATRRQAATEKSILTARYNQLSGGERQVMSRVVSGLLNKQVAAELQVREITVKVRRARIMRKMQANSITDLVRMAIALGLD